MNIELIPAALVHAELLAGMHAICFAEPWSAGSMAEILAMPGASGLIAVEGGSLLPSTEPPGPAGYVLWRVTADEAEILSIAVLPPWRQAGLGSRLVRVAIDDSRARQAEKMFLEVAANNQSGLALYDRMGFQRVGIRKKYYGDLDAVVMRRDLDAP
ncbi:GNAT family N-acetyltransferase [Magnetospirillum moscoviense]|uniref:Acetyltransferase n=1 Tax=Magnetospirillum moscoviense TaxID=1437059 RepID=A0A178MZ32_9PROT|nr:GNAT family N-acetyltransferase [Magnetospirillum moscoviense]MBF0326635.1 GNAT family N-acetyltransferase [Alphaproteobacteria bacterium]OAN65490.1 acetyltransferase [Magnetospirillum moscoviense]